MSNPRHLLALSWPSVILAIVLIMATGGTIGFAVAASQSFGSAENYLPYGNTPLSDTAAYPCEKMANREESDLCAQWWAAAAAKAGALASRQANNLTVVALGLSLLTVLGLAINISQTNRALRASEKANRDAETQGKEAAADTKAALEYSRISADAASRQVILTTETRSLQLRAYLFLKTIRISDMANYQLNVGLRAINYGKTPAFRPRLFWQIEILQAPYNAIKIPVPADRMSPAPVAPGHIYTTNWDIPIVGRHDDFLQNQRDLLTALENGNAMLRIHGRLEYEDAFKTLHTTDFNVVLGGGYHVPRIQTFRDEGEPEELYGMALWHEGNEVT